jgi:hypothetical protein
VKLSFPSTAEVPLRNGARPYDERGLLFDAEFFWRDLQPWLLSRGYRLRPRYAPDWVPSWKGTKKEFTDCEDGVALDVGNILDATRVSDGRFVVLKAINKTRYPNEAALGQFFATEPRASDPRNHIVSVYEVLECPSDAEKSIIVRRVLLTYTPPLHHHTGPAFYARAPHCAPVSPP